MMGYQTRALPGSGTWMTGRGIRNRITEWYLFVEKKKMQILQKLSMIGKEAEPGKTVTIAGKQKTEESWIPMGMLCCGLPILMYII